MKKRAMLPLSVVSTVLFISACGSQAAQPDANGGGSQTVTVGVIPIVSNAPIYLGQEQGFFEEEGLELEIETTVGGAAAVPAVVSGDFDFADSNLVSLFVAADKGLDLKMVAPGAASTGDPENDATAVIVPGDSPITQPADLSGKTVSVNTLGNIGDITISSVVEQEGGDPTSIDYVEIPFPEAEAALDSGQVDAAWVAEPFLTSALEGGARVITYNYADFGEDTPIEAYFTTSNYAEENPDIVEAFARAMKRSHEYANENPDEVRDIVGTYTQISPELREQMTINYYPTEFNGDAMQDLADATEQYGPADNVVDVSQLLEE